MNFQSSSKYRSTLYPDVEFTVRTVTLGRRMEFLKAQSEVETDLEVRQMMRALWRVLIQDFEGIEIDGRKPGVDELFLNGPEDLVDEISNELMQRAGGGVSTTDDVDQQTADRLKGQLAQVEKRIALRKNSEPPFSTPLPDTGTPSAAAASGIQPKLGGSESEEIAEELTPF